jgi:lysophospholipase L1-like esterase
MTRFVALGDSITVGIGDPVAPGSPEARAGRDGGAGEPDSRAWRGWAALLAGGLCEPAECEPTRCEPAPGGSGPGGSGPGGPALRGSAPREPRACQPSLHILAVSGACAADVRREQLPRALELRPDIASVVVGVNDTLRANFDPALAAAAAADTVAALRASGAVVLTMRLPDPGRMLGLPGILARPLARRAQQLNVLMDGVAQRYGTLHFDAAGDAETYDPRMWAVDRLHPSERGHRLIARRFHALLAAAGTPVGPTPDSEPVNPLPGRRAELTWLATKGTGWVVRRSRDLVPSLVGLALHEWRAAPLAAPLAGQGPSRTARWPEGRR